MDPERGGRQSAPEEAAGAPHARPRGSLLRGSLRVPTALAVVAANVFTFALLLAVTEFAARADRRAIASDYSLQLVTHLDDVVDGLGRFRPAAVLDWNGWRWFDDVVVAQKPVERQEGVFDVDGVYLNPLGRAARSPGFDEQRALRMISTAVESGERIDSPFGTAVPIGIAGRPLWGGVWFNKTPVEFAELPTLTILPLFLVTLAIVTLATLVLLRRNVLDPVAELAGVARRLEAGELSARARSDERDDEIGELASSFNDMATRLERYSHDLEEAVAEATEHVRSVEAAAMTQRRLAATGELAAGIAHELNNPLGGLVNAVEALKRDDLADDRRAEYLDLVSSGLRRMGETVGRLLRLSPRDARLDTVDLARPLADALGLVRHRAERQGVELRVAGPGVRTAEPREPFADGALEPFDALPRIRGAANELGQAFLNLLVNALDAIESGDRGGQGRIVIRMSPIALDETSVAAGGVRVVVEDDGPGVDAEVLARASDAFFTTKEQGKGTGLGLAIVQNVVAAHGGRVLLTSRAGEGFRVELELPRGSEESSS